MLRRVVIRFDWKRKLNFETVSLLSAIRGFAEQLS